MKKLFFFWVFAVPALVFAQKTAKSTAASTVTLICKISNLQENVDSFSLYEPYGITAKLIGKSAKRAQDGAFVFTVPASAPKFYAVGLSEAAVARVILGSEKEVTLWGNIDHINLSRTTGSALNKEFEQLRKRLETLQTESDLARTQFDMATAGLKKTFEEKLAQLGRRKKDLIDSLKTAGNPLWRYASLNLQPEFAPGKYTSPTEFYARESFGFVDFKDAETANLPDVYYAFDKYAQSLSAKVTDRAQLLKYVDDQLAQLPEKSMAYRMALGGLYTGFKAVNNQIFPEFGRRYIEKYKYASLGEIARIDFDIKKASTFTPGFEAPDLVGMTPDSSTFSLSKLRGKVVLIDFWASWCGPCRRENPNVVVNYKKYNPKGFDILGVSLDREYTAWKKAIEQDGLPWHHISDLKGWQSQHAAMYSVSSIPQTLLIDRDGKIIMRNLRGEQLGEKLKEIFGE